MSVSGSGPARPRMAIPAVAALQLGGACALAGGLMIAAKVMAAGFPPVLALALRLAAATPILFAILAAKEGRVRVPPRADLVSVGLGAGSGIVLFTLFLLYGLRMTGAAEAGIVTSMVPAATAVASVLLLGERPRPGMKAAIGLSVLGLLALNLEGKGGLGTVGAIEMLGNLLVLGAVMSEALFTVFAKRLSGSLSPLATAAWMNAAALVMVLPFALPSGFSFDWSGATPADWGSIAYGALGASILAILLWFAGLRHVDATSAAPFTGLIPVTALFLSWAMLGEEPGWGHFAGTAAVLLSLAVTARAGGGAAGRRSGASVRQEP
jgi:drug/metabolite transporter (DMT)-like permease